MLYVYDFLNRTRVVGFGPYPTEDEAAEAFQWAYGDWPEPAIDQREYV